MNGFGGGQLDLSVWRLRERRGFELDFPLRDGKAVRCQGSEMASLESRGSILK